MWTWVGFYVLFSNICGNITAQSSNYISYSITNGLPQSQVFALCQDLHGYIWAGTQGGGLAKFDGKTFENFSKSDGLNSNYIFSLFASKNGPIYIGTDEGLNQYYKGNLTSIPNAKKGKIQINSMVEWDDILLAGSNDGIFYLDKTDTILKPFLPNGDTHFGRVNDLKVWNGQLWVASEKGLWYSNHKEFVRVRNLPFRDIQSVGKDNEGYFWLAFMGYGVIKYDLTNQQVLSKYTDNSCQKPISMLVDHDFIWVGTTERGISIIDKCNDKVQILDEKSGLSSSKIRSFCKDYWGNIWIGTSGGGLINKSNQMFRQFYTLNEGLSGNRIYSVAKGSKNKVWLAVNPGQLASYNGSSFLTYHFDSLGLNSKIKSVIEDQKGKVWFGTEGQGLFSIDSNKVQVFSAGHHNLLGNWVEQVVCDRQNRIWVSSKTQGITRITQDSLGNQITTYFEENEGLPDVSVYCMAVDPSNRLWFGCKSGNIGYIDTNDKIKVFGTKNGLPGVGIKTLAIDSSGHIYAGISGIGIFKTTNDTNLMFAPLQYDTRRYSTNLYSMVFDNGSNLWVGTENGVQKFTDENGSWRIRQFKKEDGFLGIESCHHSIAMDGEKIWFGTMNGLVLYDPNNEISFNAAPIIHLNDIKLFDKPISQTQFATKDAIQGSYFQLPYDQNNISFEYKAVYLPFPEKIKYRYKLDGALDEWSEWNTDEKVRFASLSPGHYTFLVQSGLDNDHVSTTIATNFDILSPFWEKSWFKILAIFLGILSLIALFMYREKMIKRRSEITKKELEVKNTMLMLEQKALQLQMNPHFIFNALNSIQSLVVDGNQDEARTQIQQFAGLMRRILNNSRKKNVTLTEELEGLTKYLEMEQFCQQNKFIFSIKIAESIHPDDIEIPSMIIQPYVENAVIHGISHLKSDGKITIYITQEGEIITFTISDNGVGREKAAELKVDRHPSHVSLGMDVTKQRLQSMANNATWNPEEIIDLKDSIGKPIGTKVMIKIPNQLKY